MTRFWLSPCCFSKLRYEPEISKSVCRNCGTPIATENQMVCEDYPTFDAERKQFWKAREILQRYMLAERRAENPKGRVLIKSVMKRINAELEKEK